MEWTVESSEELSGSTSFGFIDTFFSFHYCNLCKWLNGVFVQQFSDLYLSEVMGTHKGCRVEAQAPREPYFTMRLWLSHTLTLSHTHIYSSCWIWQSRAGGFEQDSAYWNINVGQVAQWGWWETGLNLGCLDMSNTSPSYVLNALTQPADI